MPCRKRDFNWCRELIDSSRRFFGTERLVPFYRCAVSGVRRQAGALQTKNRIADHCVFVGEPFHSASQRDSLSLLLRCDCADDNSAAEAAEEAVDSVQRVLTITDLQEGAHQFVYDGLGEVFQTQAMAEFVSNDGQQVVAVTRWLAGL